MLLLIAACTGVAGVLIGTDGVAAAAEDVLPLF